MKNDPVEPIPRVPLWLGTGGLFPFIVLTSGLYALPWEYSPMLLFWLCSYAAVILSFVGAIHWGLAMTHPDMGEGERSTYMAWSVVPALAAWAALLLPASSGLLLMAGSFAGHYAADRQLVQRFRVPGWYLPLRGGLTAVVVLCLIIALFRVNQSH